MRLLLKWIVPEFAEEIEAIQERFEAARVPPGTMPFAYDVVKLIETDHPDWLSMNKRELARASVKRFIERNGGVPKDSIVSLIVELAVARWKAEPGHYQS